MPSPAPPGGATWLSRTASVNQLLIRLDRTGTWFRYHHLLRDLLRLEAQQAFRERIADPSPVLDAQPVRTRQI